MSLPMTLTKFGHACVRLEGHDGGTLVVDPGGLTDASALDGAHAVLVTHEHSDHFSEEHLWSALRADQDLEIWTNAAVAGQLTGAGPRVHVVGDGDAFSAAGFEITVHGTWHAQIHPDLPRVGNIGFLVDGTLFHPGDAFTDPGARVDTLLLPVHGPWSAIGELIDYVRQIAPYRALAVHDGGLNAIGNTVVDGLLGERGPGLGAEYTRLNAGESLSLVGP